MGGIRIAAWVVGTLLVAPAAAEQSEGGNELPVVDVAGEQAAEVPDSDKPERARAAVARMKVILDRVLQHLAEARDENDVVKVNCVNEKLTAVKGLLRISEQADVNMQELLLKRNSEAAAHEFEKVSIALRKNEQLLAESEACVGELAVYSGETEVQVEIEGVSEDDPSQEIPRQIVFDRPAPVSPYQG